MRERPILFSAPMVRALLDGRKTQTRRAVKPKPQPSNRGDWTVDTIGGDGVKDAQGNDVPVMPCMYHFGTGRIELCPYGRPGDRLWVKETWCPANSDIGPVVLYRADGHRWQPPFDGPDEGIGPTFDYDKYPAGRHPWTAWAPEVESGETKDWRVSIHMPRWASRITLEITGIRVERLNDISKADAICEGLRCCSTGLPHGEHALPIYGIETGDKIEFNPDAADTDPRVAFGGLWRHINGPDSWAANPWVWVIEFKRVTP